VPKHLEGAKAAASSSASGAAHAACFTMSFVRMLETANFVPEQVDSKSECYRKLIAIRSRPIASKAKAWCPVSKLMNAAIGLEATLVA